MQRRILFILISLVLSSSTVGSEPAYVNAPQLDGFSPVSYFTKNRAERGSAEYTFTYKGLTYHLSSAEQVSLFSANPEQYLPRYKSCPYSITRGMDLPIDPQNFRIVGGHLLLFHKSEQYDGLVAWQNSGLTEEQLLQRADRKFILRRF